MPLPLLAAAIPAVISMFGSKKQNTSGAGALGSQTSNTSASNSTSSGFSGASGGYRTYGPTIPDTTPSGWVWVGLAVAVVVGWFFVRKKWTKSIP
jgi:hypothetical protein